MRSNLELLSLPPSEFPPGPDLSAAEPPVMMPAATLTAIRRVAPCASSDETRYVLNGVFITRHLAGAVVATDGRRLAMQAAAVATADAILPKNLVSLLDDAACQSAAMWQRRPAYRPPVDEPDGIHLEDIASMKFPRATLTFRIIDGNYPNYRQVIPSTTETKGSCTFPPASLAAITGWLRQYGSETVALQFASNVVTFEVRRPDKGTFTTQALGILADNPPTHAAYNAGFLADALAMGLHTMDLIDEMSPAVLTDGQVRFVLMPMRVMEPPEPVAETTEEDPTDQPEPTDLEEDDDEEEEPEPFDREDAPEEFLAAFENLPGVMELDDANFQRILTNWYAAGEPEVITTFIATHAFAPEPQDELAIS